MMMNPMVNALLTDMYQISMTYSYFKSNRHNSHAIFDMFFRKAPFDGQFTIFAGLGDVIQYVSSFSFSDDDIEYIKSVLPNNVDPEFFKYLKNLTTKDVTLRAVPEGTIVFPKTPLIVVEGPLAVCQLLETALLNLCNFSSLIATNAKRMKLAAGENKIMLEFGLRRAQGPDGAMTASKFAVVGGFDGTSNCLAGKYYGLSVKGTMAHAYIMSFDAGDIDQQSLMLDSKPFWTTVQIYRSKLDFDSTDLSELLAFATYAVTMPTNFLALVDTYDTMKSGVPNFLCVALALIEFGYKPIGIRLDSGDLSYFSIASRRMFKKVQDLLGVDLSSLMIVASNDINEDKILALNTQGHEIDCFGVGTNLVTCQKQPALGMVYKLVEIDGRPSIKLSADVEKMTIPGRKALYRLKGKDGEALCDLITFANEAPPAAQSRILCQHPHAMQKRCIVTPSQVENLLQVVFKDGDIVIEPKTILEIKSRVSESLECIRHDYKRLQGASVYKVSVSSETYQSINQLWSEKVPVMEFS